MTERKCVTPTCREKAPRQNAFCWRCRKLVDADENWALRMAQVSPMVRGWTWGGRIDGTEHMWQFDHEGNGQNIKGVSRIETALHYVEFWSLARAVGHRIAVEVHGCSPQGG